MRLVHGRNSTVTGRDFVRNGQESLQVAFDQRCVVKDILKIDHCGGVKIDQAKRASLAFWEGWDEFAGALERKPAPPGGRCVLGCSGRAFRKLGGNAGRLATDEVCRIFSVCFL